MGLDLRTSQLNVAIDMQRPHNHAQLPASHMESIDPDSALCRSVAQSRVQGGWSLQFSERRHRPSRLLPWLLVLVLAFLPMAGTAQAVPGKLSLSQAVQQGLANNFDILIADKQTEIAANNNSWGLAGRYPSIVFSIAQNNRLSEINNPASFLNGQFSSIGVTPRLDLNWTLFNGFAVRITKQILEQLEAQSRGNAALIIENNILAIILQYHLCLLEQERLQVLFANLEVSRDRYAYIQTKKEIGTAVTFDLLQVENAWLNDSTAYALQKLNFQSSLRTLKQLMGEQDVQKQYELEVREGLPEGGYDYADLEKKLLSRNRSIQLQYLNLEILNKDLDLARAARYPRIDLNLGLSPQFSRVSLEGQGSATGNQIDYFINFSLNWTLFNGGNIKRSIANAETSYNIGQLSLKSMQHSMKYLLRDAYDTFLVRESLINLTDRALASAQLNLDIAGEKFRNGTITSFDYRDVQLAYLAAALSQAEARYQVRIADVQLAYLIGGVLEKGE